MVGGSRFSVFGRPLLDSVKVEATVVEKTTTYPELEYIRDNHNHIKVINCTFWSHFSFPRLKMRPSYADVSGLSEEMTVLRINEISAKDLLSEPSS